MTYIHMHKISVALARHVIDGDDEERDDVYLKSMGHNGREHVVRAP